MDVFKVDGVEIPTPSSFNVEIEDISSKDSGRTMDGNMHKDIIATKVTLACSWHVLKWDECAALLNAVGSKAQFDVTYPDPRFPGRYITRAFYVGSRKAPALSLQEGRVRWRGTAFNFIEV